MCVQFVINFIDFFVRISARGQWETIMKNRKDQKENKKNLSLNVIQRKHKRIR